MVIGNTNELQRHIRVNFMKFYDLPTIRGAFSSRFIEPDASQSPQSKIENRTSTFCLSEVASTEIQVESRFCPLGSRLSRVGNSHSKQQLYLAIDRDAFVVSNGEVCLVSFPRVCAFIHAAFLYICSAMALCEM